MHEFDHDYMHEHEIEHSHDPEQHGHIHTPDETKAVVNRLARAIGHLEHVKMMVEVDVTARMYWYNCQPLSRP